MMVMLVNVTVDALYMQEPMNKRIKEVKNNEENW